VALYEKIHEHLLTRTRTRGSNEILSVVISYRKIVLWLSIYKSRRTSGPFFPIL